MHTVRFPGFRDVAYFPSTLNWKLEQTPIFHVTSPKLVNGSLES